MKGEERVNEAEEIYEVKMAEEYPKLGQTQKHRSRMLR